MKEPKDRLYLYLKLFLSGGTLWPLLAITLFITMHRPIFDIVNRLPHLISRSTHISIAGVSVQVEQHLRQKANPEIILALSKVSPAALRFLMGLPTQAKSKREDGWYEREKSMLGELSSAGLAYFKQVPPDEHGYNFVYGATLNGEEVKKLLEDIVIYEIIHAAVNVQGEVKGK